MRTQMSTHLQRHRHRTQGVGFKVCDTHARTHAHTHHVISRLGSLCAHPLPSPPPHLLRHPALPLFSSPPLSSPAPPSASLAASRPTDLLRFGNFERVLGRGLPALHELVLGRRLGRRQILERPLRGEEEGELFVCARPRTVMMRRTARVLMPKRQQVGEDREPG